MVAADVIQPLSFHCFELLCYFGISDKLSVIRAFAGILVTLSTNLVIILI